MGDKIISNFDLLTVGITSVAILILGAVVFFHDRKSRTSQAFFLFALLTVLYGGINYMSSHIQTSGWALWLLRLTIFFATWHAFSFFHLFYIFPEKERKFPKWYRFILFPFVVVVALLTLTPFVFESVQVFTSGQVNNPVRGPLMPIFAITAIAFVIAGLALLVKKFFGTNREHKKKYIFVLVGSLVTFSLLIVFNVVLPLSFHVVRFVSLAPVFILPFVALTSYAIIKHRLLDVKVVSTEILVFGLLVALLFEVISSEDFLIIIYKLSIFLLVFSAGLLLIKSVRKEVEDRQRVSTLAHSLEKANTKLKELDDLKTEFLSIATHQLRTPLSIIKGYIELIEDGAYGKPSKKLTQVLKDMDMSNERLVKLVDEFLDVTRIEQGRTQYHFEKMDFGLMAKDVLKELIEKASQKQIVFEDNILEKFEIVGDTDRLRHGVFNFVDNAIKYSPAGSVVKIHVSKEKRGVAVRVMDEGPGLDEKDINNLFQKFYRSPNISRDFEGTGLGIYVCRKFIEAHGGRVWADSKGLGKGSEFGFWVPEKQVSS